MSKTILLNQNWIFSKEGHGEPVTLPPMNAHDRRIIHITLEGESDLQTESTGEGNFKSVVISLKK